MTSISVSEGDGLPQQVCVQCVLQISRSYTLRMLCEKSDAVLRAYMSKQQLTEHCHQKEEQEEEQQQQHLEELIKQHQNDSMDHHQSQAILGQNQLVIELTSDQFIQLSCGNIADDVTSPAISLASDESPQLLQDATLHLYSLDGVQEQEQQQQQQPIEQVSSVELAMADSGETLAVDNDTPGSDSPFRSDDDDDENSIYGIVLDSLSSMATQQIDSNPLTITEPLSPQFGCSKCSITYHTSAELMLHHSRAHPPNQATGECDFCGKTFTAQRAIRRHMKIHLFTKPHACQECGATFADASNLAKHQKRHTGELRNVKGKPLVCKECGKRFKWASSLYKHQKHHTGKNLYCCSRCPKVFAEAKGLQMHYRTHTGEMPFQCSVCSNRFTQEGNLKKHMRTHEGGGKNLNA